MAVFAILNLQVLLQKYEACSFWIYICTKLHKPRQNFRLDIESNRKLSRRLRLAILNSVQISFRYELHIFPKSVHVMYPKVTDACDVSA